MTFQMIIEKANENWIFLKIFKSCEKLRKNEMNYFRLDQKGPQTTKPQTAKFHSHFMFRHQKIFQRIFRPWSCRKIHFHRLSQFDTHSENDRFHQKLEFEKSEQTDQRTQKDFSSFKNPDRNQQRCEEWPEISKIWFTLQKNKQF